MSKPTDPQDNVNWREVLRNNSTAASKVLEAAIDSAPEPSDIKGLSTDQYALQAAKAQGWRDAVNYIFKDYPNERFTPVDSPFMDTTIETEKE